MAELLDVHLADGLAGERRTADRQVVLKGAVGSPALNDGFELEVGQQFLITAADGNVNFCGYSGPATPELTAAFDAAFQVEHSQQSRSGLDVAFEGEQRSDLRKFGRG